ncbi:MAG: aminomethyl-transferring glycine dehydrogenase subunit GcvPA [Deltaproteobacteria bacterium]|nr:aminomethyl-transferring glycine dehydrogenase subunit GcvPA [Deltaproteobacteria bacterium]
MRYIPHTEADVAAMLGVLGRGSIDELIAHVPEELRSRATLEVPDGLGEADVAARLTELAAKNRVGSSLLCFAGAGAYPHFIPSVVDHVILRSEFATAYTPYQPEVSQGTLQATFEFQTLVASLLGLEVANASLYDGSTATAEAVLMSKRLAPKAARVLVARSLPPQYREVVRTYLEGLAGLECEEIPFGADGRIDRAALERRLSPAPAAVVVGYPNVFGVVEDLGALAETARGAGSLLVTATAEAMALGLLRPPGALGADIAVGEGQSFGIPLSFGGPYLGLFATRERLVRGMPGRLVGETVDEHGRRGYVLTLATREQHIRRERATSNICTNQGLCALAATVFLALAGRGGLREIADRNARKARYALGRLRERLGAEAVFSAPFFNEFAVRLPDARRRHERAVERGVLAGVPLGDWFAELEDALLVCATEVHSAADVDRLAEALAA